MILGDPAAASGDHPADIDYGLLDLGGNVTAALKNVSGKLNVVGSLLKIV